MWSLHLHTEYLSLINMCSKILLLMPPELIPSVKFIYMGANYYEMQYVSYLHFTN